MKLDGSIRERAWQAAYQEWSRDNRPFAVPSHVKARLLMTVIVVVGVSAYILLLTALSTLANIWAKGG